MLLVAATQSAELMVMITLGIETSGLDGSIAIARGDECIAERPLNQSGRRHAQGLVLEIRDALRSVGLTPRDVECVAVSRGPGSFTGLRVGMVCAKTFAYATGCRFIAVDTFAAIASNAPADLDRLFVIEDAQRDELFVGEYVRDEFAAWRQTSPIRIVPIPEFCRERTEVDTVTGPGIRKLESHAVSPNWLSTPEVCRPRASVIAALGCACGNSSEGETDFWIASPFYLRLSAAEEKRATLDAGLDKNKL